MDPTSEILYSPEETGIINFLQTEVAKEINFPDTPEHLRPRVFQPVHDSFINALPKSPNAEINLARYLKQLALTAAQDAHNQLPERMDPADFSMAFSKSVKTRIIPVSLNEREKISLNQAAANEFERQKKLAVPGKLSLALYQPPERLLSLVLWEIYDRLEPGTKSKAK